MQQNIAQKKQYDDEINLFEIIDILIQSKTIIIVTTLIISILSFIYSVQIKPTYQSDVLIEIGHYEKSNGTIELLESPESLIEDLHINLKYKMDTDLPSVQINDVEERLIKIKQSSKSAEKNIDILNQYINYLNIRHSSLANIKHLEKKEALTRELNYISSEIELYENLERLKISSLIEDLEIQIPSFELQISNFKKIITEDEENLKLLKVSPDVYLERAATNPTLNQVIHQYKEKLVNLTLEKDNAILLKTNLEERLNLLENKQLPIEPIEQFSQLLQAKNKLEIKLREIENQKNFHKTQTIREIKTSQIDSKKTIIPALGLIVGLITGIFLVFVSNFVKTFRERKA